MANLTVPDGTTINWESTGDGPPVVLVHGITESAATWRPVAERLDAERVVTLDLRGHGGSGTAERYDLEAMATDVIGVMEAADAMGARLVGHSLGGVVASAVGALGVASSVVCVDQSLRLGAFQETLRAVEPMLRDPDAFGLVIGGMFDQFRGALDDGTWAAVEAARRADQSVVLGVWDAVLTSDLADLEAVVAAALGGYTSSPAPYLSLFGADPGAEETDFLTGSIPGAVVEHHDGVGHYPHLVDPDGFVARIRRFWADAG